MRDFTLGLLATAIFPTSADSRPNVILILTDDLGHSDISYDGAFRSI